MRASIITVNALLVVCAVSANGLGSGRAAGEAVTPVANTQSKACRDAAWPYVPAECGAQGASGTQGTARPVRVLRAEAGR